ncbi:MAG: hypothetical protein WCA38_20315 [Candidatus Acidiferrales bacterium]
MSEEIRLYVNYMEEIRDRINFAKAVGAHHVTTGHELFDVELVFLQLRKMLELIAFASLTASKETYSAAYKNFDTHWRAKGIIICLIKTSGTPAATSRLAKVARKL